MDAIYKINYTDDYFRTEEIFTNKNTNQIPDIVATEDSTSVAALYSQYLDFEVLPVFSRSSFYKYIKRYNTPLVIADKPKFGQGLLLLIYRFINSGKRDVRLLCYLPASFEEFIAQACLNDYDNEKKAAVKSFDEEDYFEELVKREMLW